LAETFTPDIACIGPFLGGQGSLAETVSESTGACRDVVDVNKCLMRLLL